jgi:translation initiation factor IF-3
LSAKHRINNNIRANELRLIGSSGENIGVVSLAEALRIADEAGLDLVEVSPNTLPPIAKVIDYGKFLYAENKKLKATKAKIHTSEVKNIQVKVGTGEHDLALKARKASEWLKDGDRVKIDLFLPGRTKYMNETFLKERLDRVLKLISVDFRIAEAPKKSPKGMTTLIEKAK